MGLKFQRDDSLERKFDEFAFLPPLDKEDKEQKANTVVEKFLKTDEKKSENS